MAEKHIMVSLGDSRIKDISEVIGNKTCNKILDYLVEKEATTTEISNELKIPINTVDYNVKKLLKSGLIESANSWWSVKGKKMPSYRVSNKKIVIYPKKYVRKNFFFALALTGLAAIGIKKVMEANTYYAASNEASTYMAQPIADLAMQTSQKALASVPEVTSNTSFLASINPWQWFLIGAWFAIVLFIITNMVIHRRRENGG